MVAGTANLVNENAVRVAINAIITAAAANSC